MTFGTKFLLLFSSLFPAKRIQGCPLQPPGPVPDPGADQAQGAGILGEEGPDLEDTLGQGTV